MSAHELALEALKYAVAVRKPDSDADPATEVLSTAKAFFDFLSHPHATGN